MASESLPNDHSNEAKDMGERGDGKRRLNLVATRDIVDEEMTAIAVVHGYLY